MLRVLFLFFFLCLLLTLMPLFSSTPSLHRGPVSDHFDGQRFFNPGKPMDKGFWEVLKWRWTRQPQPWPEYSELPFTDKPPQRVAGNQLRVSFVGHVTLLIQTQGLNILTDPVWSDRASPFTWIGPKRVHPPGIRFEDLPPIGLVLISHNHYDHLDLATPGDAVYFVGDSGYGGGDYFRTAQVRPVPAGGIAHPLL